jgi:hypothetical protein
MNIRWSRSAARVTRVQAGALVLADAPGTSSKQSGSLAGYLWSENISMRKAWRRNRQDVQQRMFAITMARIEFFCPLGQNIRI